VAWTLVFFRRHSILGGVALIVGLWLAIVATILAFARVNWKAALLLVPYLLWVSFAGYLNVEVWRLNR
jgi:benzodiazapine receptor